jgi:alkaline phosphatase
MRSFLLFVFGCCLVLQSVEAQEKPVRPLKNVILMIPDGTSAPVVTLSRWVKMGRKSVNGPGLNIDPWFCGFVKSYNSDSPIGDSAPTGSAYATGQLSQTGFVATYPPASPGFDLISIDPKRSWHPMLTVLEAAKMQGKRTGLIVTCQFPHATPADFSAHTPNRGDYDGIARQMVHNRLNVVFGGGTQYLSPLKRKDKLDLTQELKARNYRYFTNANMLKQITAADTLAWGCFAPIDLPYVIDQKTDTIPSLAEMTSKALEILSSGKNGFFLMVEGSKVDWAAHDNHAEKMVSEFLAFDDAVKVAIDFAKKDGNTAVVICPDHGNSGISIGNKKSDHGYDRMNLDSLINLKKPQYIGFTTGGHTGEDVFLAVYHPDNNRPTGVVQNTAINRYLQDLLGIPSLDALSEKQFVIDTVALAGLRWEYFDEVKMVPGKTKTDTITDRSIRIYPDKKSKQKMLVLQPDTDYITVFEKGKETGRKPLSGLVVYIDNKDLKKAFKHIFMPGDIKEIVKIFQQ